MNLLKEIYHAFDGVTIEWFARGIVNAMGRGFDPNGCTLPAWGPEKKPPTAQIPKHEKPQSNGRGFVVGYDAEGLMYDTGKGDESEIEIDGLTEREYGEMLAYTPPLRDISLAVKVKDRKEKYTLLEISEQLRVPLQTIKHYSSALNKASPLHKKNGVR